MALRSVPGRPLMNMRLIFTACNSIRRQGAKAAPQPEKNRSTPNLRFIQFRRKNCQLTRLGVVSNDGTALVELSGGPCISNDMITFINQNISPQEISSKLTQLKAEQITDSHTLLPPVTNPGKIVCVGLNYKDHCDEQKVPIPKEPIFFSKFSTALVGPLHNIVANKLTNKMDWEAELAVIIGKACRQIPREKAMEHVFGYTIAQDITAREWQKRNGGQWMIGKSMDTFCPLGPSLVHKSLVPNVNDLYMRTCVNGVVKQDSNTSNMIFKIDDIISRLTQFMTLLPGDIILTGTPKGVGMYRKPPEYLKHGDIIETEIQCMGKMVNQIIAG